MGLLTGLTFGLGVADLVDKDLSQFMSGMGSILAGIGTVLAAIVAYRAYKKWHKQHDYLLVQNCVTKVEELSKNIKKMSCEYINIFKKENLSLNGFNDSQLFIALLLEDAGSILSEYRKIIEYMPRDHNHHDEIDNALCSLMKDIKDFIRHTPKIGIYGPVNEDEDIFHYAEKTFMDLDEIVNKIRADVITVFKS